MDVDLKLFNKVVFEFLKTTDYPIGKLEEFPLIENDEIIGLNDVFEILEDSGVGVPAYYKPIEYQVEIDGEIKRKHKEALQLSLFLQWELIMF